MICLFTGALWLCNTKASLPRTLSSNLIKISPFAKSYADVGVIGMPSSAATSSANSGYARPENRRRLFSEDKRISFSLASPSLW